MERVPSQEGAVDSAPLDQILDTRHLVGLVGDVLGSSSHFATSRHQEGDEGLGGTSIWTPPLLERLLLPLDLAVARGRAVGSPLIRPPSLGVRRCRWSRFRRILDTRLYLSPKEVLHESDRQVLCYVYFPPLFHPHETSLRRRYNIYIESGSRSWSVRRDGGAQRKEWWSVIVLSPYDVRWRSDTLGVSSEGGLYSLEKG
ncbi:hypothetical protein FKM82_026443 [Ascaphus truei]